MRLIEFLEITEGRISWLADVIYDQLVHGDWTDESGYQSEHLLDEIESEIGMDLNDPSSKPYALDFIQRRYLTSANPHWSKDVQQKIEQFKSGGPIEVFRGMSLSLRDMEALTGEGMSHRSGGLSFPVGRFWSWDFGMAAEMSGGGRGTPVVLRATIDPGNVDWANTMAANAIWGEREIRPKYGAPVNVMSVLDMRGNVIQDVNSGLDYIAEAPVRDFYVDDSVTMPDSTWTDRDKRLLDNPKIEVLARKRIKTAVPLDMYFLGLEDQGWLKNDRLSSAYDRILTTKQGIIGRDELYKLFGVRINPASDAINVVYLSNTQDTDTANPMTPWIMMHRLSHALLDNANQRIGADFWNLSMQISADFLTMKTGRHPDMMVGGEEMVELLTQYLHDGEIKLARAVSENRHGVFEMSNGVKHYAHDPDISRDEFNRVLTKLEAQANREGQSVLQQAIGEIVLSP